MVSTLSLFVSLLVSDAAADEKGLLDHTQSVTVAPVMLAHPRAHLEYEGMISKNTSFTAGANYGRLLSLDLLWLNLILSDLDAPTIKASTAGVNGAFNYYFEDFNRGWYASGAIEFNRNRFALDGKDYAINFNTLKVGPTIGWKRVTAGGFTFSIDGGIGYTLNFGATAEINDLVLDAGGEETRERRIGYLGSMRMGYSF